VFISHLHICPVATLCGRIGGDEISTFAPLGGASEDAPKAQNKKRCPDESRDVFLSKIK